MKQPNLLGTSALWSVALFSITCAASPAFAQATAKDSDEEIVVTGSRIARPDFAAPNPVKTITAEDIEQSGETNLLEFLQHVPALVGSWDSGFTAGSAGFIGSTGLQLLNLRNLGVERTLVLVDGRRHVASLPETAAVDIGNIPEDLIDRVEIITGGAGAVYGADAVSGVVNFLTKKNFEGISAHAVSGISQDGTPNDWRVSVTGGHNFGGGRGNIAVSLQASNQGAINGADRHYLRHRFYRTMQRNINDPSDDPNIPDQVPVAGVSFFDSSREGGLDIDFDGVPDLRPNGEPYIIGTFIPPFFSVGGTGTQLADYIGDIRAKDRRYIANAFLNYEFSDLVHFFAEGKYVRAHSVSASQPTFDYFINIPYDNAFLPASIRDSAIANDAPVLLNRDNFDLGIRADDIKRDLWRAVAGFKGNLSSTINYEISYTFGQTKVRNLQRNNRFNDRFLAALDAVRDPATGNIVCRSNLDPNDLPFQPFSSSSFPSGPLSFTPGPNSGCVPLNLLGEGVASPAAIDWVMTDSLATSKLQQHVVSGFITGSVPGLSLPGGDIGFVVGGEWRKEKSHSVPALEDQLGQTFGNVILPTKGQFSVKEAFAEVRLPILKDKPFFYDLELNAAGRISDYTTVGKTWTWNASGIWAPVRDIKFRGTYARAVRAPNIGELFGPASETFLFIDDPCDKINLNNGTSTRAANCATLLSSLGVANPANFTDPNSTNISGFNGGNPNLSEETAKSWTAGVVLNPGFIRGLNVSLDWYNIKITNAINTPTAQTVAEHCVDAPDLNNVFCDSITRQSGGSTPGRIISFIVQPQNVAAFRTSGLDFQVAYHFDAANIGLGSKLGTFDVRLTGNYLHKLTFVPVLDAEVENDRGTQYAPKWQANLEIVWHLDPVTIDYSFDYWSKTLRYSHNTVKGDPDIASKANKFYNARHLHNIYVSWDVEDKKYRFYVGVNNIFNQKPDLATYYPVNPLGRFFFAGFKANLADVFGGK